MENNKVQTSNTNNIGFTEEQVSIIKNIICKGASDDELKVFLHMCERTKLDPFSRQIYAIKRFQDGKEVMTPHTGIDGLRLIADRTRKYMPSKEATFVEKNGKLISATSYVKKLGPDNQWHEVSHTVYFDEYAAKKKDGTLTTMWKDKPKIMLSKCAESALLRKAFPADLSGLYIEEEFHQVDVQNGIVTINAEQPIEFISSEQAEVLEDLLKKAEDLRSKIYTKEKISSVNELKKESFVQYFDWLTEVISRREQR